MPVCFDGPLPTVAMDLGPRGRGVEMRERMGGARRSHDGHTSKTGTLSKPNKCCLLYEESNRCGFSARGRASWSGSKGEAGREPRHEVDLERRKKSDV